MIIHILNDNIKGYDNATTLQKLFFIESLNTTVVFNLFRNKKYLSLFKALGRFIYFRFLIKNHYRLFNFYSKKDSQKFELLFSPCKVIVISHYELSLLQEKTNDAFHNTIDTFIYLYTYNLYSIASRFEYYEKIVSSILLKKHIVHIPERILIFMDYFFIKKRFIKNQRTLTKIIKSSSYSHFSDAQKNSFNTLMDKNIITLNYLLKFDKRYLLFGPRIQQRINSFIATFLILSIFTICIIYFCIINKNDVPFLALLFLFTVLLLGYALNNIQR